MQDRCRTLELDGRVEHRCLGCLHWGWQLCKLIDSQCQAVPQEIPGLTVQWRDLMGCIKSYFYNYLFVFLFSFRTFPDRQHTRMCRCLVIIIFVFKVSSHLSNGVDSSLSKSFPHFLRLQVFKYFQERLRLQTFKIFECIQHALRKFSCHPFRCMPSSVYPQDLHSTSMHYASCQPLSTGFVHSRSLHSLLCSIWNPYGMGGFQPPIPWIP